MTALIDTTARPDPEATSAVAPGCLVAVVPDADHLVLIGQPRRVAAHVARWLAA